MLSRRGFLTGLATALAAPAIIRTPGLLMPVRALPVDAVGFGLASLKEEGANIRYSVFGAINSDFADLMPEALERAAGWISQRGLRLAFQPE